MIIVAEVAPKLKAFLGQTGLKPLAQAMMLRMVLAFIMHRGRMSCSVAAGAIAAEPIHRGELTRFLARPRWQKHDFNEPLMRMLLAKEKKRGKFLFLVDALGHPHPDADPSPNQRILCRARDRAYDDGRGCR